MIVIAKFISFSTKDVLGTKYVFLLNPQRQTDRGLPFLFYIALCLIMTFISMLTKMFCCF